MQRTSRVTASTGSEVHQTASCCLSCNNRSASVPTVQRQAAVRGWNPAHAGLSNELKTALQERAGTAGRTCRAFATCPQSPPGDGEASAPGRTLLRSSVTLSGCIVDVSSFQRWSSAFA
ncbi:hypothetical protein V5799_028424, partial [Amblyomma americanum]